MVNNAYTDCDQYETCSKCRHWCDDYKDYMNEKRMERQMNDEHVYKRGKGGAKRQVR